MWWRRSNGICARKSDLRAGRLHCVQHNLGNEGSLEIPLNLLPFDFDQLLISLQLISDSAECFFQTLVGPPKFGRLRNQGGQFNLAVKFTFSWGTN